jgi:hypothetical protein
MEKQIKITLEQAIKLYKNNKELRPTLLNSFTLNELEEVNGFFISNDSSIISVLLFINSNVMNKNIFATKEQAESSLAKAQLSQLLKEFNGNWKADFSSSFSKYAINKYNNLIAIDVCIRYNTFLIFKTKEKAELFLLNYIELIEQYLGDI